MALLGHGSCHDKVKAATLTFEVYLQATASPAHYIQVHLREYPVRRVSREVGLNLYREGEVKSKFLWSDFHGRWIRKDGGILIAEGEIWQVIRCFLKATVQDSAIDLYDKILGQVEGIDHGDVQKVWMLWKESGLSRAKLSEGAQWDQWDQIELLGPDERLSTAGPNFSSGSSMSRPRRRTRNKRSSVDPSNVQTEVAPHLHPMVLRSSSSAHKRRRTSIDTSSDASDAGGLSDSDVILISPSELLDMCDGRQVKDSRIHKAPVSRRKRSVQPRPASTYDAVSGESRSNGSHRSDPAPRDVMNRVGEEMSGRTEIHTILRVSTSDKPEKAPINVLLGNCGDVNELFRKVLSECSVGRALADRVCQLSAKFTWNGRET